MRPELMKKSVLFGCLCGILFILAPASTVSAQIQDADYFKKQLSSDSMKERKNAAKRISRSDLTDPELFDMINDMILKGYTGNALNAHLMDEIAWLCKALSSSGDTAYAATLKQVADGTTSAKLKRHAINSLERLNRKAKKNQILNTGFETDSTLSEREKELIAMVRSQDPVLIRNASKIFYRDPLRGEAVTDAISEVLLDNLNTSTDDKLMTDALAWMCKALGNSGKTKYRATLTEVIEKTTSGKLKKYAKQSIRSL